MFVQVRGGVESKVPPSSPVQIPRCSSSSRRFASRAAFSAARVRKTPRGSAGNVLASSAQ